METYDIGIIGGGPAGLAAAIEAERNGKSVLMVERESKLGGILKQCIHDGFGLIEFDELLTGPEYALRFINEVEKTNVEIKISTFVHQVEKKENFILTLVNEEDSVHQVKCKALILANGCRERTSKQISIHGTRPAGIYTAGTAQYFVNILGELPTKRCVILGSGDIGLIMARRLTLEGAEVLGVYEIQDKPSGLTRNVAQCLDDYNIPLHLSKTVTKVIGEKRVEAVEVANVDKSFKVIEDSKEIIECDSLILSVGLIPENEIAEMLGIEICPETKGPFVDQTLMTSIRGVFSSGNSLHVNDLVDYVSETGRIAASNACDYLDKEYEKDLIEVIYDKDDFLYVVPQYIDTRNDNSSITIYLRLRYELEDVKINFVVNGESVKKKRIKRIKPPEMERIKLDVNNPIKKIEIVMEGSE
ncbi:FAD-dependent oxidoreductase [Mycoplasmatota bacterium WC44]